MFGKKKKPEFSPKYLELRGMAFKVMPDELSIEPQPETVWGVVMESRVSSAVISLVAFAEGSVSLYFSNGGGVIGGGAHEKVRDAAGRLLYTAQQHYADFSVAEDLDPPAPGRVRFYIRTLEGTGSAEANELAMASYQHPLAPLFHAAQEVITQIRLQSG